MNPVYKIALIGGSQKQDLTMAFLRSANEENESYDPTTESRNLANKKIDNVDCTLDISDQSGSTGYSQLFGDKMIKDANGILLVYSITSSSSFDECLRMHKHILMIKETKVAMVLVGDECHLEGQRQVQTEKARKVADEWNIPFYEASSTNVVTVDRVFESLVREIRTVSVNSPPVKAKPTGPMGWLRKTLGRLQGAEAVDDFNSQSADMVSGSATVTEKKDRRLSFLSSSEKIPRRPSLPNEFTSSKNKGKEKQHAIVLREVSVMLKVNKLKYLGAIRLPSGATFTKARSLIDSDPAMTSVLSLFKQQHTNQTYLIYLKRDADLVEVAAESSIIEERDSELILQFE